MRQGEIYMTNSCGNLLVLDNIDSRNIVVQFINTGFKTTAIAANIKKGKVKDPMGPSVCGIGYRGVGAYTIKSKAYGIWNAMLRRCYSKGVSDKYPAYKGCSVSTDWHNFQTYARWFEGNYVEGYQVDKDLLVIGNKLYSADTCVFIPSKINTFTIDCSSSRGKYPIGVSYNKRANKYTAYCSDGNGSLKHLGLFTNSEQAHLAWRNYKLGLADKMKVEMDGIDKRIYPNVVTIINNSAKGDTK